MTIFVQFIRKFDFCDHICNTLYLKLEIKDTKLTKKDIDLLKTLDDDTLKDFREKLKRKNNLPLIVRLMERVKKL